MSINKITLGQQGEDKARAFLEKLGYKFIVSNYRYKKGEIDLIMSKEEWLVFVEVKQRKNKSYGHPEEFVSEKKVELYQDVAEHYMYKVNWEGPIRFDIVAVMGDEVKHFEDAF